MEENEFSLTTKYELDAIANLLHISGVTCRESNKLGKEYLIGNITENDLLSNGFEKVNDEKNHIYRLGNIEAVFIGQILHLYAVTCI